MHRVALFTLLRGLLPLALALGVLAWLLRGAELDALARHGRQVPAQAWLLAAAALTAGYLCRAQRVKDEWQRDSLFECWKLVMLHNLAVLWLPLRAGEAGYVVLVHRRFGAAVGAAVRSLLRLRLQDAAVLGLLALLLLPTWAWGWRVAACGATVLAAVWLGVWPPTVLRPVARRLRQRWPALATGLATGLAALLARPPGGRSWARSWALSATNWLLKLAALGGLLALLLPLPWAHTLAAALAGELAGALPLQGPAGLGTYEAAVWAGSQLRLPAGAAAQAGALAPGQVALAALAVHAFALACATLVTGLVHAWPLPRPITPRTAR